MADITPKSLTLIGTAGEPDINLIYGEEIGDPRPIILTVTQEYVAHKTSKPLPIHHSEFARCLDDHAEDLRKIALDCRNRGKTSAILTGMTEPGRKRKFVVGLFDIGGSLVTCARYVRMFRGGQPSKASKAEARGQ
jgi:hypothetical protein